jgi:hypothetical protein
MNPFSMTERADRASMTLLSTSAASTPSMRHDAGQRPQPPDARLVQQIEALSARVELLEKRLRSLSQCAVQQYWDGRLHLPVGKLSVIVGGTRMTMESTRFSVVVNGKEILGSAVTPSGQSLQQMSGGSGTSWQSSAAGNAIENPLIKRP